MNNGFIKISLLALLGVLLTTQPLFSQHPPRNDVANAIARFDRELEMVKELLRSFPNEQAVRLVAEAERLRSEAGAALESGNPVIAGVRIRAAFTLLEQAVKTTLEAPINRWRSRLEQLLQRADQEVIGSNNKEAERLLQLARQNRDEAEKALANRQGLKALEHLRVAVKLVEQALDLVGRPTASIEEERRRFEILRQRAQEMVEAGADKRAAGIFQQALKMSESAEQAFLNGENQLAKRFYNQAILLLLRAMDLAKGTSLEAVNQVEVALFRLREEIDHSKDVTVSPRANLLVERARRFAVEAELASKAGRSYEALWKIDLAENMLRRAHRLSEGRGGARLANKIQEEIENTKLDIAELQNSLTLESSADAEILLNMAHFAVIKAEQSASAGFDRVALEAILAAQRFLTKAERILNSPETEAISKERIESRLAQLDEAISELENRLELAKDEWNRRLLEGAKEIRDLSAQSIQQGNYRAADEGIQVAFELIRKSMKHVQIK